MDKKLLIPLIILTISLFLFSGCGDDGSTGPEPVNEFNLVAAIGDDYFTTYTTASGGINVTIDAVADNIVDESIFIIDFRSAVDFEDAHIINAHNIAIGDLVTNIDDGTIPADQRILCVCYTGQTASVATALLNMIGYDAQNLMFGMCSVDTSISGAKKWLDAIEDDTHPDLDKDPYTTTTTYDFPTLDTKKSTAEEIIKAQFSSYIASGWGGKDSDLVWDYLEDYFIINYWSETEYNDVGHIPGAYQFTPKASLQTTESLNLLPTDKPIVVYCYTGQTSAQVVTYLKILGYEAYSLKFGVNGFGYNAPGYENTARLPEPKVAGYYDDLLDR